MSSFASKVEELMADYKQVMMNSIENFNRSLRSLRENLTSLSAKASAIEEEIKDAERSGLKKRKREVEEWLREAKFIEKDVIELGTKSASEGFIRSLMDGGKVAQLNEKVVKLDEQSRNFGELVLDDRANGLAGKAANENFERILKLLETRQVSSIGVYGMGGVGKTTLANHIHDRLRQQSQVRVFWITVSEKFTITSLQDKIACFIGLQFLDEDNEHIRATKLCIILSRMKGFVLILDDVWQTIDLLKMGCPISAECCRLIITSRSLKVCHRFGCEKLIRVEKLPEDEAWKLFHETLGNEIKLSRQVEETAKSVAKLCDGLPLGIITVAGSLRGESSIHTWRNALVELKERVFGLDAMELHEVYDVLEVLKYSFDRLNVNYKSLSCELNTFQLCFMYCSLYPKDYEMCREDLVIEFITEGLVDGRSWTSQVHQGLSIIDKLVNVRLLESRVDYHDKECVRMHDLVRAMVLKIVKGRYMVRAGNESLMVIPHEQEWTKDLEKVSLMSNYIRIIRDGTSPDCPHLSTLLLRENPLEAIPSSFFFKMQGLRTLDLCRTLITMLPNSVSDLTSLEALLLESCENLEKVPYLGKLKALRELNLGYTAIEEVPQGVEELLNLKFLSMVATKLEMLPRGLLFKLEHLQYVKYPFRIQVPIEEIENLKGLEHFGGRVNSVHDFNCFIRSRVHDDLIYKVLVGGVGEESSQDYSREASLFDCNLEDEKVLGSDIEDLIISECEGLSACLLDVFSPSNHPKSLKCLRIQRCRAIECILTSEKSFEISELKYLHLDALEDLKGLYRIGEMGASGAPTPPVFSSLKRLAISKCSKMSKLGLPVSVFPNLEEITISNCVQLEQIFEDEGKGHVTLPKLQELKLSEMPRLRKVCEAPMICNLIKKLHISRCPRLMNKLPLYLDVPPPSSLEEIEVDREWWESLEWDNPNLPQLLKPFVDFTEVCFAASNSD